MARPLLFPSPLSQRHPPSGVVARPPQPSQMCVKEVEHEAEAARIPWGSREHCPHHLQTNEGEQQGQDWVRKTQPRHAMRKEWKTK